MNTATRRAQHRATSSAGLQPHHMALASLSLIGTVPAVWVAAQMSARLDGARPPDGVGFEAVVEAIANAGDPMTALGSSGSPGVFWTVIGVEVLAVMVLSAIGWKRWQQRDANAGHADRSDLTPMGANALVERGDILRPAASKPKATDLGWELGSVKGHRDGVWASVEDTLLVVAPPRTGKTAGFVVPGVWSAPGPVVVTGTRPEVVDKTAPVRSKVGKVFVCDPQGMTPKYTGFQWAPARGCDVERVAMERSGSLVGAGVDHSNTENGDFWTDMTKSVVRAYLLASARADLPISRVIRWAGAPTDPEPVTLLQQHGQHEWARELSEQAKADPKQRGSVWAGVVRTFDCLADPELRSTFDCLPSEGFQPATFLEGRNTLGIIGSASIQETLAPLVAALVEDVTERARERAAHCPDGRCEPPLSVVLDECANIAPLPKLPTLMSDGGGSGISTMMVLQSIGQGRKRWGKDAMDGLWEAARIKVVLGGGGNAEDLKRLSDLAGEIDEEVHSETHEAATWFSQSHARGAQAHVTVRKVPIWPVADLRQLENGSALVLAGTARLPTIQWRGWWDRPEAKLVEAA